MTNFNYTIIETSQGWILKLECADFKTQNKTPFKCYLSALKAVQLLQLPINDFDQETLKIADRLNLKEAA